MTLTHTRLDFPGWTREETRVKTGIEVYGVHGGKPQAGAVGGIGVNVLRASADYAKEQADVSVDNKNLLELRVMRFNKAFVMFV